MNSKTFLVIRRKSDGWFYCRSGAFSPAIGDAEVFRPLGQPSYDAEKYEEVDISEYYDMDNTHPF